MSNEVVKGLWIGDRLSKLELLTIKSFIAAGHVFRLWVYQPIITPLPEQVIVADANEIIPEEKVFFYKNVSEFGHGKGSYAGFSDIFRYKLLYEKGGWWTDMDVTCLKKFDFDTPYFFRNHHVLEIVGSVIKCPPKSDLMRRCYEEAITQIDEYNQDWHKPIFILEKNIFLLGLEIYVYKDIYNQDDWNQFTKLFVQCRKPIPPHYYFIHWQNENWRYFNLDKDRVRLQSTLAEQMQLHGLLPQKISQLDYALNKLYYSHTMIELRKLGVGIYS